MNSKKKVALVLSGGGIKAAAFHIGVCLALKEKGFQFLGGSRLELSQRKPSNPAKEIRLYVGSSAGAFITALLASGYGVETLIQAFRVGIAGETSNETLKIPPIRYRDIFALNGSNWKALVPWGGQRLGHLMQSGGFEFLLKERFKLNGLFSARGIESYLRTKALPFENFEDLGVDLFVVGTQLNHSRKVIFGKFPDPHKTDRLMFVNYARISEAVAASIALPPVFAPYEIEDPSKRKFYFYDGEIRDTLSTHIAADHGADLVISSYSVMPYHFQEKIGSLHKFGVPVILNQALYQLIQQKIDRHIQGLKQTRAVYDAISSYCKHNGIPGEHRDKLLSIIETHLGHRPDVDYIDISPKPSNSEMFFTDHFSLNAKILERIIRIGFRSALAKLSI